MKPTEIQTGQKYTHCSFPNALYLGVQLYSKFGFRRGLIVTHDTNFPNVIGMEVNQDDLNLWTGFSKVEPTPLSEL